MSTIVEASVPASQFALQETAERVPDASFEAVRIVADGDAGVTSLLWCIGGDAAAVSEALAADESTTGVRELTRCQDTILYHVQWRTRVRIVTRLLLAGRGAILSARSRDGVWTFRVLYPERAAVAAAVESCDRHDVDLRVERIAPMTESAPVRRSDLTDEQFRTVKSALEHGYYDVPRGTTLTELADELGVSHQALSERLRRGHRQLVETALGDQMRLDSRR